MTHGRLFGRWRCITHDAGSYNYNQLLRHEIDSCDIITEYTVGIVKPKTFGGFNGDISRQYLPEYIEDIQKKELERAALQKWDGFIEKKKHANKFKRIYKHQRKKTG